MMRRRAALGVLVAAAIGVACSGGGSEDFRTPGGDGNLLLNPGFEAGQDPWFTLHPLTGFTVSSDQAHSGSSSALLRMSDPASASGMQIYDVTQEFELATVPEVVSGWYYVGEWVQNTPRQYLQMAAVVFAPENLPEAETYQIRYVLAGTDSPPYSFSNAEFRFVSREAPVVDEWVEFELPVRQDFEDAFGVAPEGFDKMRFFFEVRWDGKQAGDGEAVADVYYDDLYAGSAQDAP
jgi:hypothetical protein